MKIFIGILLSMITVTAMAFSDCKITKEQENVIRLSYSLGEPHDLGLTMIAIAMEESKLGKYRINLNDPSAGIYHTTVDKAVNKLGWSHTPYNYNRAAQILVDDDIFAGELAIETILWWKEHKDGDWRKTVSGYNGGHVGNPEYVKKISNHIKTIKACGWLEEPVMMVYR